jgi:hypothetical protein
LAGDRAGMGGAEIACPFDDEDHLRFEMAGEIIVEK